MFRFLPLLLTLYVSQATAVKLTWDDYELATGLHVASEGKDKYGNEWTLREAWADDTSFYQGLFADDRVIKMMGPGRAVPVDTMEKRVAGWVDRFAKGLPFGGMSIKQGQECVGYVHLAAQGRPGVGDVIRAFEPESQGKGLGKDALRFLVEELAPIVRKTGLGQNEEAPSATAKKFQCFGGKPLSLIYTTAHPSNVASWKSYRHFDFEPSPPEEKNTRLSCEEWEESQHGSLEDYLVQKYFSSDPLKHNVLYSIIDENGELRTLSYVETYSSLRYHLEREVE